MKDGKVSIQEKAKNVVARIRGMKKRYYVIFGLLALFFSYNTVSLRGFYYAENHGMCFFGFMDRWHGHTTAVNRSYRESDMGKGYVATPVDIHDVKEAREWYGSIFGTVVFMKWKWVGLHLGDYMILIDTWVPDYYSGDQHILGHPYYILHRYDAVQNYPIEGDLRNDELLKKWNKELKAHRVEGGMVNREEEINRKHWERDVDYYRRITMIFYCGVLLIFIAALMLLVIKRRRRLRLLFTVDVKNR